MNEPVPHAASQARLPDLVLYSRPGCHLCDEARANLRTLLADRSAVGLAVPMLIERDISADPILERAYLAEIPVIELGDRRLALATSPARMKRLLHEALDS